MGSKAALGSGPLRLAGASTRDRVAAHGETERTYIVDTEQPLLMFLSCHVLFYEQFLCPARA